MCSVLLPLQSFSPSLIGKSGDIFEDYEDDDENAKDGDNILYQNLFPNALGDDTDRLPIWMECKIYDVGMAMRVRENAATTNIRAYIREYRIYSDMQKVAHGHP